ESGRLLVTFVPGHHSPSHPGEFVGERDGSDLGGSPRQQSSEPGLLRIVGALNGLHVPGTLVPVEEPCTAPTTDSCSAAITSYSPTGSAGGASVDSFGQPRFPQTLNQQLRV